MKKLLSLLFLLPFALFGAEDYYNDTYTNTTVVVVANNTNNNLGTLAYQIKGVPERIGIYAKANGSTGTTGPLKLFFTPSPDGTTYVTPATNSVITVTVGKTGAGYEMGVTEVPAHHIKYLILKEAQNTSAIICSNITVNFVYTSPR